LSAGTLGIVGGILFGLAMVLLGLFAGGYSRRVVAWQLRVDEREADTSPAVGWVAKATSWLAIAFGAVVVVANLLRLLSTFR